MRSVIIKKHTKILVDFVIIIIKIRKYKNIQCPVKMTSTKLSNRVKINLSNLM